MRINTSALRFGAGSETSSGVPTAGDARGIATKWLSANLPLIRLALGLPEIDDRYAAWRVSIINPANNDAVGELRIACRDGAILQATSPSLIHLRLDGRKVMQTEAGGPIDEPKRQPSGTDIFCGDARDVLKGISDGSVHLAITSPPYYNAKPEYSEYVTYEEYLALLRGVFLECHRVLSEGRFMVVNASPVLVRRPKRSLASKRIPVPFHINAIMEEIGFDFLDDIIWVKPTGAGWNTGRGRRFAADRHPLQYKPVPVTEYFLVYRKRTDKLIDWNIRAHPDQAAVTTSRISDGYEITNVWREVPAVHSEHPAVFPESLIRKLIRYYSFRRDIVLDPFAGVGTVGRAAIAEERGFLLMDVNAKYVSIMRRELQGWQLPHLTSI